MTTNQEIFGNVVTIALDGKELNLTPTLGCCKALTRTPGLEALRQRVVSYDLEAVVAGRGADAVATVVNERGGVPVNVLPDRAEVGL